MRIWHKDLVPILPKKQLVGQWRELCAMSINMEILGTPNHILVNKIMRYPMTHFMTFCDLVKWNMTKYGYSPSRLTINNIEDRIGIAMESYVPYDQLFDGWHNDRYLYQCISNLEEKYDCGGIPYEEWEVLDNYISEKL